MDQEWQKDEEDKFICRFNDGCHCDLPTCGCCGWNPEVGRRRLRKWLEKRRCSCMEKDISSGGKMDGGTDNG